MAEPGKRTLVASEVSAGTRWPMEREQDSVGEAGSDGWEELVDRKDTWIRQSCFGVSVKAHRRSRSRHSFVWLRSSSQS